MAKKAITINKLIFFFKRQIWRHSYVRFKDNPLIYIAQRLYLVFNGLFVERHWGYAAQLTYNTLMALVPMFAAILAIARGFGFEDYIVEWCRQLFANQPNTAKVVLNLAKSYINYTHTGVILGISLVWMLYSVISLFNNIEAVFNGIWGVKKERSMGRAITDYVSILIFLPLTLILLSGLSIFFQSIIGHLPEFQLLTPILQELISFMLPLSILTLLFISMYTLLPNTKVRVSMIFIPALMAAFSIIIIQSIYIHCQVFFASYNLIYGSLAALPLLMLWLQLSWYICIGFAELGRANQELTDGRYIGEMRKDSPREKLRKACVIMSIMGRRQMNAEGPTDAQLLQQLTSYTYTQIMRSINDLIKAKLITKTLNENNIEVFTLNHDSSKLTMGFIIRSLLGAKARQRKSNTSLHINDNEETLLNKHFDNYIKSIDNIAVTKLTNKKDY